MLMTMLLIVHGLVAVALLGAITHQAAAVLWPVSGKAHGLVRRFRAVSSDTYVGAVIGLYLVTMALGAFIYTHYTISARIALIQLQFWKPYGMFEIKEHFAAIGLGILPLYWILWRAPNPGVRARAVVTTVLATIVWWNFLVGHIINDIRGFGS
jgi:hypothetical protein